MDQTVLQILLTATDQASGVIAKTTAQLGSLGESSQTASDKFTAAGSKLNAIGTAMLPASLAAAGILGVTAKAAADFEQKMELLHTQAGLAQTDVDALKGKVLALGPTVGAGPNQLADAFYHIASAGNGIWDTAKMLDILKVSAEGAAIGQANLDDTTYALTSAMASGVKGAKDAAEMMSTLNAIVGAGDMRMQDLNGAISTGFLSTAAAFGISIQSVGTALATLTDNGEHADAAATRLRMTWALMGSPSHAAVTQLEALGLTSDGAAKAADDMNKVFAKTGLTTTKLSEDLRKPNGMTVAMQDLQDHVRKAGLNVSETDAILAKAFGGGRTDAAILTMLQNLDRMNEKFKLINQGTGNFANDWAAQQQTASQHVKDFQASWESLSVKFGNDILPTLTKVTDVISHVFDWIGKLNPKTQQWIVIGVALVAVLAPIVLAVGALATAIGFLIGPIGLVILSLMALGLWLYNTYQLWVSLVNFLKSINWGALWEGILGGVSRLFTDINGAIGMFVDLITGGDPTLRGFNNDLVGLATFLAHIRDAALNAGDAIGSFWSKVTGAAGSIGGTLQKGLSSVLNFFKPGHNASGTNNWQGGFTWVGEQGPELVNLPAGSQVIPSVQSQKMTQGSSTYNFNNYAPIHNDIDVASVMREFGFAVGR